MAGKYYTLQEVMEKLGKSEDQVKDLVKEGTLRQYLDKGQPLYDQAQVDGLSADQQGLLDLTAAGTDFDLQLEETAEIKLEPDDKSKDAPAEKESEGGFGLSMAGGDLTNADTRASSFGINVLDETDDGYKLAADTQGETSAGELEEIESLDADANLESVGSGSGLLDLSLQADDTSLGAVLDDILPAAGEGGGGLAGEGPSLEEPAAGLLDDIPMAEAPLDEPMAAAIPAAPSEIPLAASEPMAAPIPSGPSAQLVAVAPVDPGTTAYGFAMLVPFIALIIATIALAAGLRDISPGLLKMVAGSQIMNVSMTWWVAGGLFMLTLIVLAIFGAVFGEKKTVGTDVYQKPKKEKKAKKEKKKKK